MSSQPQAVTQPAAAATPNSTPHYEDLKRIGIRVLQGLARQERLNPNQTEILRVVIEHGSCSQAQVMEETGFSKHKVSKTVCQLTGRRLLQRGFDEQDSRKHTLQARSEGRKLLTRIDQLTQQELQRAHLPREVSLPSDSTTNRPSASEQNPEPRAITSSVECGIERPADAHSASATSAIDRA